eukprot:CAMPEP_0170811424 /NCGR_PEP_ID=MMETSP0733-20121128/35253_1 /TAXON_ID=186038 /ORGANISM="Fragilariopsis kerguelensis, Strain L26-C5" /LENGTH=695 /DNA_ID=CAMNT_0011167585 /DNA_START=109 /DNA_END=2197 /DNA_ORIENTATION=-
MNSVPFHCLTVLATMSMLLTITNAADIHHHDHVQGGGASVSVLSSTTTASATVTASTATASSLWVGKEDNSGNDHDLVQFQLEARFLQESALNEFVEVTSNVQEVPVDSDSDSLSAASTNSTEENEDHHDDHSEDCHCDGDIPHCATLAFETSFHCGEHHNEEEINCHCDGDIPHCSNPADAPSYSCDEHSDGQHEEHSDHGHDETGCHCDGDIPHCEDPAEETSYNCDNHDGQHEGDHDEHQTMEDNGEKPWWEVVIFSLIINVSTLAGVVVVAAMWLVKKVSPIVKPIVAAMWLVKKVSPNCQTNKATVRLWVEVLIPMFACGALLATTFFILLPESYVIVMSEFTGGDPHAGHNHRRFLSGDDEEEEPKGEAAGTWRWGSSIMGGFWIPVIMHACFPHDHNHGNNDGHGGDDNHGHDHGHNHNHDQKGTGSDDSTEKSPTTHGTHKCSKLDQSDTTMATTAYRCCSLEDSTNDLLKESPLDSALETGGGGVVLASSASHKKASRASDIVTFTDRDDDNDKYENENDADYIVLCGMLRLKNLPLFISMNIGEALHNFTDGVFVGTALLTCGRTMAITISIATILHELPNQLAGWFVMVNQNGINPWIALLLNFLFGLSILLGGLLVFLFEFSQVAIGCVLAIGGGTFIHVAIGELLQNAERNITHGIQMLYAFVAFLVGAIPIGLILINHEHC